MVFAVFAKSLLAMKLLSGKIPCILLNINIKYEPSCGPLITLFLSFFFGLSAGSNVVVARCIGARNKKQTSQAVHTAVALAVAGGLLLAAGGVWASRSILILMATPAHVLPKAVLYIQLYCAGAPLILVYNYGAAVLRATGDTRRPMIFLLISGVIKVLLCIMF